MRKVINSSGRVMRSDGHLCEPYAGTRKYIGKINGDTSCWIKAEVRRAITASLAINHELRGRVREMAIDAIIEGVLIEIADLVNMEVEK